MKLKHYLSAKKLKRKLSRLNVNEPTCKTNSSFIDYNDNDMRDIAQVSKDDMYLRPKREGRVPDRSDMTKSFTGALSSGYPAAADTRRHMVDHESQTDVILSLHTPAHTCLCIRDHTECHVRAELCTCDSINKAELCFKCAPSSQSLYHSLPVSQSQLSSNIHYNSLPSSRTASLSAAARSSAAQPTWRRSRIKTNPWLPLPKEKTEMSHRERRVDRRTQPRLSRFISEVEELMREQLTVSTQDQTLTNLADVAHKYSTNSTESLASTCSTATEIPVRKTDYDKDTYATLGSPSEGYKSAGCMSIDSECNMADTESFSDSKCSSRSTSSVDSSKADLILSHSRPSLQDFTASLSQGVSCSSYNSLQSEESLFSSLVSSSKCDALEDKVRKLCMSTNNLNEKMRLARLECSYIKPSQ